MCHASVRSRRTGKNSTDSTFSLRQFPSVSPDLHKGVRSLSKGILPGKTYRQDRPERLVVLSSVMPSMAVSAVTKKDEAR